MELYNYYSEKGREHGMNKEVKDDRSQEETRNGMRQEEALNQKEREQYNKLVLTPISRLIPKLAVPTIISMMISMIYNVVDAYFVGKLGTSASAAIGILASVQAVFQAVGFMFGHGSGSIISRKLGAGDEEGANRFLTTAFWFSLIFSSVITIISLIFLTPLMRMLGSTETILPYAKAYGIYILVAGPALAGSCVLNNVMRYEGKAFYAMIGLVSGGVLNMIGDPILMFGLHMGIHGAGLSTAISQYISFFILLSMFTRGKTISSIRPRIPAEFKTELVYTIQNWLPSLIRQMLNSFSSMVLNRAAAPYGDAAIAAMAIVGRVVMLIGSAMIGIGQGYQPVAAYNYGAEKYSRVRRGFFFTWLSGEALMLVLTLFGFAFPESIIRVFRDDPKVIAIGVPALRYQCIAVLLQPFSVTSNMMFQSIGKHRQASVLSAMRSGIYFIPSILILTHFFGLTGLETAQLSADILTVLTSIPFVVWFMHRLPLQDAESEMDRKFAEAAKTKEREK